MNELRFRFETGAATHEGCVRTLNEDRFLSQPDSGVWLVADGMGGHWGGDFAAMSIVEHVGSVGRAASAPDLQARFEDRIARANGAIQAHSARHDGVTIGATVAALLVHEAHFACLWAGDSRVYLMRDGRLAQLSRDHTEVQELLDRGAITPEQAEVWPRRNVITRAVGVHPEVRLDQVVGELRDRDVFLLCSDGLTGHLDDAEIRDTLAGRAPQAACDRLVQITLDRGATDNVTVVAVRCASKTLVNGVWHSARAGG
jgi:serine/threonine protein phosphatase PrpC